MHGGDTSGLPRKADILCIDLDVRFANRDIRDLFYAAFGEHLGDVSLDHLAAMSALPSAVSRLEPAAVCAGDARPG